MNELFLNLIIAILVPLLLLHPLYLSNFRWYAGKKEHCERGGVHKWIGYKKTAIKCDSWLCRENELIYKHKECVKCKKISKYE